MAFDTRGLASGFVQGFGLMDSYERGKKQDERAERGLQMQEEAFQMKKDEYERKRANEDRQRDLENIKFTLGKISQGLDVTEEEVQTLGKYPQFWPMLDAQTDEAIQVAEAVVGGEMSPNDPKAIWAMNQLWGARVNRGEGGQKAIAGLYPGNRSGHVAFDLRVTGEDGTTRNAPMTVNRGVAGEDDEILQTPVEELIKQVHGFRVSRNAFRTPEAQAQANKVLSILTGKTQERDKMQITDGGLVVNPYTGEKVADYRLGKGGEDTVPWNVKQSAERIQKEMSHLWDLEHALVTGMVKNGQNIMIPGLGMETVTDANRDQIIEDVRARMRANELEFNRIVNNSSHPEAMVHDRVLRAAQSIPAEDRDEFLADLKADPRTPYSVVQQVEAMFKGGQRPAPNQPQPPGPEQQPAQQPIPQPGQPTNNPMGLDLPPAVRAEYERQARNNEAGRALVNRVVKGVLSLDSLSERQGARNSWFRETGKEPDFNDPKFIEMVKRFYPKAYAYYLENGDIQQGDGER